MGSSQSAADKEKASCHDEKPQEQRSAEEKPVVESAAAETPATAEDNACLQEVVSTDASETRKKEQDESSPQETSEQTAAATVKAPEDVSASEEKADKPAGAEAAEKTQDTATGSQCEVKTHEITRRMGRSFDGLFPGRNLGKSPHSIVTLTLKTRNRQTAMTTDMLAERTEAYKMLVDRMEVFREKLTAAGHWCDFIDPSSGAPFHSDSPTTFAETDDRVRTLGFEVLELGCCRAVCCKTFGQCMVMTSAFIEAEVDDLTEHLGCLEVDP